MFMTLTQVGAGDPPAQGSARAGAFLPSHPWCEFSHREGQPHLRCTCQKSPLGPLYPYTVSAY